MLSWRGGILWDNESFFCEPFVVSTAAVSGGVTGQVQHGPASSLSGCSCRGVWLAPIKRMGITDRNKYVESGEAGRAGRPADQIMVTQSLTQAFVC